MTEALVRGGAAFYWRMSDRFVGRDRFGLDRPAPQAGLKFQSCIEPQHSPTGRLRCQPNRDSTTASFHDKVFDEFQRRVAHSHGSVQLHDAEEIPCALRIP